VHPAAVRLVFKQKPRQGGAFESIGLGYAMRCAGSELGRQVAIDLEANADLD
jgi:hypothetical protein